MKEKNYKELLSLAKKFDEWGGDISEAFNASYDYGLLMLRYMWYVTALLTGREVDFGIFSLYSSSSSDAGYSSGIEEFTRENLSDTVDGYYDNLCYTLDEIFSYGQVYKGRHWKLSVTDNPCDHLPYDDVENEYFSGIENIGELSDTEIEALVEGGLPRLLNDYFPMVLVDELMRLLKENADDILYVRPYDSSDVRVLREDFWMDAIKFSVGAIQSGDIADELIYKAFLDMTDFRETDLSMDSAVSFLEKSSYSAILEKCDDCYDDGYPYQYYILYSRAIGYIAFSDRGDLSESLRKEIKEFETVFEACDGLMPFIADENNISWSLVDGAYMGETYASPWEDYTYVRCSGNPLVPCIEHILLLDWADDIYDKILEERRKKDDLRHLAA